MKEFMLLIRNEDDGKASLTKEDHLAFVKKCEEYINALKNENRLIAAQPLICEGFVISKKGDGLSKTLLQTDKQIQVGYYHILANDIEDAVRIAKSNPEFEFVATASIEVRPIKIKEEATSFQYPNIYSILKNLCF